MAEDQDQVETVPVLRTHLETILDTLDRAAAKSAAEDMVEHYRNNRGRSPQQSTLTASLSRAYSRVAGYLGIEDG